MTDRTELKAERQTYYIVMVVIEEKELQVMGQKQTIDLNWSDGMIGCLPVFETWEDAYRYANEDSKLVRMGEFSRIKRGSND